MMRRWRDSAARVRCYAAATRVRRASRSARASLEYLRRARTRTRGNIVVHARFAMAIDVHMPPASRRGPGVDRASSHVPEREMVRHGWAALPVTHVRTARVELCRTRSTRTAHVLSNERRATTVRREERLQRLTSSTLERVFVTGRSWLPDQRVPRHDTESRHNVALRPSALPRQRLDVTRVHRLHSRSTGTVARRRPESQRRVTRRPTSERAAMAVPAATTPLPLDVVDRKRIERTAAAAKAFAAQPQPFAPASVRTAIADAVPVERIERTLRESLTVVAERTVQRELDRTLRSGTPVSRRLRESIQSEMYDDIVFERERRGER